MLLLTTNGGIKNLYTNAVSADREPSRRKYVYFLSLQVSQRLENNLLESFS